MTAYLVGMAGFALAIAAAFALVTYPVTRKARARADRAFLVLAVGMTLVSTAVPWGLIP